MTTFALMSVLVLVLRLACQGLSWRARNVAALFSTAAVYWGMVSSIAIKTPVLRFSAPILLLLPVSIIVGAMWGILEPPATDEQRPLPRAQHLD
jgi:hypothetical protein